MLFSAVTFLFLSYVRNVRPEARCVPQHLLLSLFNCCSDSGRIRLAAGTFSHPYSTAVTGMLRNLFPATFLARSQPHLKRLVARHLWFAFLLLGMDFKC